MVQDPRSEARQAQPKGAQRPLVSDEMSAELREAAKTALGAEDWKRSKLGYLSGMGVVKGGFRFLGQAIGTGIGTLGLFYRAMIGRGADDEVEGVAVEDAGERFVESMRVHGKTLADVDQMQNSTYRGCMFFGVMTLVAVAFGLGSYAWSPPVSGVLLPFDFVYRFVAVAPLAALALKWGYTNWMLRRRRYDGVGDYLRSGEWAPERVRPRKAAVAGVPARTAPAARKAATGSVRRNVAKAVALAILVGGLLAAMPAETFAQTTTPTTQTGSTGGLTGPQDIFKVPGEKDLFMRLLSFIAPSVGPVPGFQFQNGTSTPAHQAMAAGFMAFISALFFLAGMQVAWHTVSGIVATAQEGKVLGQKWHQVWAPVRVVSGVGFLAPAFGGFCVAQIVVLYLIAFGGQLANLIWSPYVDAMISGVATPNATNGEAMTKVIGQLTSSNDVLRALMTRELCLDAAQQNYTRRGKSPGDGVVPSGSPDWVESYSYKGVADDPNAMWTTLTSGTFDANAMGQTTISGQMLDYGPLCGKIVVPVTSVGGVFGSDTQAAVKFSEARKKAVSDARDALKDIAKQAAISYQNYESASASSSVQGLFFTDESTGGALSQLTQAMQSARNVYEKDMIDAARDVMNSVANTNGATNGSGQSSLEQFAKGAKDGGWATAGVYYMTISRVQSSIFSRAGEMPKFIEGNLSSADQPLRFAIVGSDEKDARPGPVTQFNSWADKNIAKLASGGDNPIDPYGARAGEGSATSNPITMMFNKLEFGVIASALRTLQPSPLNPLGDIVSLGHTIVNLGWTVLIAVLAVAGASGAGAGVLKWIPFAGSAAAGALSGVMSILGPIIVIILLMVFAMGITMAFIIPMIPYIMVLFFIIGMLVLTLEALIAAPLWAFFHVRMDGQDLIDQVQKPGYMIAFNLLLRPSLMILGYILSFFAFSAIAWFITVTFATAVASATQGYLSGPITFLVMGGMMAYLYYQAAIRSFQMIVQVPDRVTRWFGVGGENLGEERHAEGAMTMVGGAVSRRAEAALQGPAGMLVGAGAGQGGNGRNARFPGAAQGQPALENPHQGNMQGGGSDSATAAPAAAVRGAVDAGVQANEQSDSPQRKDGANRGAPGSSQVADKQTPNSGAGKQDGGKQETGGAGGSGAEQGASPSPGKESPSAPATAAAAPSGGKPPAQAAAPAAAKPADYSKANPKRLG